MYDTSHMKSQDFYQSLIILLTFVSVSSLLAANELLKVGISPLSTVTISTRNSVPANIISLNHSAISAEVSGRALDISVEAGDFVKTGQKLVALDCRSYELSKKHADAALKVTKAQLNLAKKELLRNQRLIKNGTIPHELFDKTKANQQTTLADIEIKKVAIETSRLAISRCIIKAPFAGQITERMVQNGQLVMTGTPLFQLMQNDKLEVKANLSPTDVAKLEGKPKISFIFDDKRFKTTVRSIIQTIDPSTRTQEVRFSFLNEVKLASGLSGRIEWNNLGKKIPSEFIQRRNANLGVMIAEDIVEGTGKAKFITLNNAIEGQPANINLPDGTAIISKNQFSVTDGQTIRIQK